MLLPKDLGSCVAWWYLTHGWLRTFIAVFLHHSRPEFMIELAEGSTVIPGWTKDEHYTRPHWAFPPSTRREALAMVMKYACAIATSRQKRGFALQLMSFHKTTGTALDAEMLSWEGLYQRSAPVSPAWWPTTNKFAFGSKLPSEAKRKLEEESYDIIELIKLAKDKARRFNRRGSHDKVYKRIGRFTVFIKTDDAD